MVNETVEELSRPMILGVWSVLAMFLTTVLVYFYGPYWGVRRVPGPVALPLVGNLPLLAKHGPHLFSLLAKQYGPIFRFHMGRQPLIIVADPELCREVAIKKFKDIPNRSIPSPISASPLHQKGLFFTRGEQWSAMRNTILTIYQPSHISKLVPTMQSVIESATQNLQPSKKVEEEFDFSDFSLKLATDLIGEAAFGFSFGLSKPQSTTDVNGYENDQQGNNSIEVQEFINQHMYSTKMLKMDLSGSLSTIIGLLLPIIQRPSHEILKRIPGTMDSKASKANENLTSLVDEIVAKRMNDKRSTSKDLLSLLLNGRDTREVPESVFTPDYISAVTYEHLLAGSATTSFTLSCVVYLVAGHLEVEKKLVEEIDAFGPHDRRPNANDLQLKFPYLHQVIKEAMRFYIVSPLVARETSKEVEVGGYHLPKGTWVWLALGVLAKDPKNFPEPDKFKPERFDPNSEEEKQRHAYANIPFGIGPRACIGQKFALQEIMLSLVHLYRKFIFRGSPNMERPLAIEYGLILNFKNGVKLKAIKRT